MCRKRRPSAHPSLASTCGCGHTHAYMHACTHPYAPTHTYSDACMCAHTREHTQKMNRIRKKRERERQPFYVRQHHKRMGTQVLTRHPIWSSLNLVLARLLDFRLPSSMAAWLVALLQQPKYIKTFPGLFSPNDTLQGTKAMSLRFCNAKLYSAKWGSLDSIKQ